MFIRYGNGSILKTERKVWWGEGERGTGGGGLIIHCWATDPVSIEDTNTSTAT